MVSCSRLVSSNGRRSRESPLPTAATPGTMRGGREDSQRWCFPPSPARRPARRRRRNPRASQSPGRIRLRRAKTRPARRRRVWLAAAQRILRGADHAEAVADALQHATREGSQGRRVRLFDPAANAGNRVA